MPYLVGTDEAGYGPNLGPLVVSATVWRVDSLHNKDVFGQLKECVRPVGKRKNKSRSQGKVGDEVALFVIAAPMPIAAPITSRTDQSTLRRASLVVQQRSAIIAIAANKAAVMISTRLKAAQTTMISMMPNDNHASSWRRMTPLSTALTK